MKDCRYKTRHGVDILVARAWIDSGRRMVGAPKECILNGSNSTIHISPPQTEGEKEINRCTEVNWIGAMRGHEVSWPGNFKWDKTRFY